MITIINVRRRYRKASGGYEKLVYGKKGVFFSLLLDYPLSCSFLFGVFILFFSNPFAICTSYFRPLCKLV